MPQEEAQLHYHFGISDLIPLQYQNHVKAHIKQCDRLIPSLALMPSIAEVNANVANLEKQFLGEFAAIILCLIPSLMAFPDNPALATLLPLTLYSLHRAYKLTLLDKDLNYTIDNISSLAPSTED